MGTALITRFFTTRYAFIPKYRVKANIDKYYKKYIECSTSCYMNSVEESSQDISEWPDWLQDGYALHPPIEHEGNLYAPFLERDQPAHRGEPDTPLFSAVQFGSNNYRVWSQERRVREEHLLQWGNALIGSFVSKTRPQFVEVRGLEIVFHGLVSNVIGHIREGIFRAHGTDSSEKLIGPFMEVDRFVQDFDDGDIKIFREGEDFFAVARDHSTEDNRNPSPFVVVNNQRFNPKLPEDTQLSRLEPFMLLSQKHPVSMGIFGVEGEEKNKSAIVVGENIGPLHDKIWHFRMVSDTTTDHIEQEDDFLVYLVTDGGVSTLVRLHSDATEEPISISCEVEESTIDMHDLKFIDGLPTFRIGDNIVHGKNSYSLLCTRSDQRECYLPEGEIKPLAQALAVAQSRESRLDYIWGDGSEESLSAIEPLQEGGDITSIAQFDALTGDGYASILCQMMLTKRGVFDDFLSKHGEEKLRPRSSMFKDKRSYISMEEMRSFLSKTKHVEELRQLARRILGEMFESDDPYILLSTYLRNEDYQEDSPPQSS